MHVAPLLAILNYQKALYNMRENGNNKMEIHFYFACAQIQIAQEKCEIN